MLRPLFQASAKELEGLFARYCLFAVITSDGSYASPKVSNVINVIDDIRILLDNISEGL
jgi:hypothetical protein